MRFAVAVLSFLLLGPATVWAQGAECNPVCDFTHYYGPYNYAYRYFPFDYRFSEPAVTCLPLCDRDGYCSPYVACDTPLRRGGRVLVRTRARR
jgi:hypothetical protein